MSGIDATVISRLAGTDDRAIEALLDEAFGTDRFGRTAYRIRLGMAWLTDLSFAIHDEAGRLTGLLQSWPVALHGADGAQTPLVMVGPVAVAHTAQGGGIGRALVDRLVAVVDTAAESSDPLVMIGDPEYYGRFWDFSADATGGWTVPGPVEARRLLVRAAPGATLPAQGILGPRRIVGGP